MTKNRLKIKVCGMRDAANIKQVLALKPDYMGFILYPRSKRYLGEDYQLITRFPKKVKKVGVFVGATFTDVVHWHNRLGLDYVQIHGNESPEYCKELHQMHFKVIKAFGVDADFDFSTLEAYAPWCEYLLFDTKTPQHGGSGLQFDWSILKQYSLDTPIFLSGGIGSNDAAAILEIEGLPIHAVDINSKFEDAAAQKNIEKLSTFFSALRNT